MMKNKGFEPTSQLFQDNIDAFEQQIEKLPNTEKQSSFKDFLKRKSLSPSKNAKSSLLCGSVAQND